MRKIIHVDMDCFFAAVEMRDNPALRDIPIAIGGSRERRGVISTANYPARKFGVRSAMPTGMALKLCPHLTLLPGRFDAYKEASNHIREIFSRYTSRIEPLSLDEAYLDVTDSVHCHGSATLIAQEIRQTIGIYQKNAAVMHEGLTRMGLEVIGGKNAPYLWVATPEGTDSWGFFHKVLENAAVVCTPGVGFGAAGEGYVRMTAFGSPADTVEALERLAKI